MPLPTNRTPLNVAPADEPDQTIVGGSNQLQSRTAVTYFPGEAVAGHCTAADLLADHDLMFATYLGGSS